MRSVIPIGTLPLPPEPQPVYYPIWHCGKATSALAMFPTGFEKTGGAFCAPPGKSSAFPILAAFSDSARAKESAGAFNSGQRDAGKGDRRATVRNIRHTQILITAAYPT